METARLGASQMQQWRSKGQGYRENQPGIARTAARYALLPFGQRAPLAVRVAVRCIALENPLFTTIAESTIRENKRAAVVGIVPAGSIGHSGALLRVRRLQVLNQKRPAARRDLQTAIEQQSGCLQPFAVERPRGDYLPVRTPVRIFKANQKPPASAMLIPHTGEDIQGRGNPARRRRNAILHVDKPHATVIETKTTARRIVVACSARILAVRLVARCRRLRGKVVDTTSPARRFLTVCIGLVLDGCYHASRRLRVGRVRQQLTGADQQGQVRRAPPSLDQVGSIVTIGQGLTRAQFRLAVFNAGDLGQGAEIHPVHLCGADRLQVIGDPLHCLCARFVRIGP